MSLHTRDSVCAFCHRSTKPGDKVCRLSCGHVAHVKCVSCVACSSVLTKQGVGNKSSLGYAKWVRKRWAKAGRTVLSLGTRSDGCETQWVVHKPHEEESGDEGGQLEVVVENGV